VISQADDAFAGLTGEPSDATPAILATGTSDISTIFTSMAERHPEGADANYLRWHTLDHRPEQYRLSSIRASLRVVSTPTCRAARAASATDFDAIDHVMTYFFADIDGLGDFGKLSDALRDAGRAPFILNPVQRGVYIVRNRHAAARSRLGADVLPWLPVKGLYLLIEEGNAAAEQLVSIPGVAGVWTASAVSTPYSTASEQQQISYLFLDDDPVAVAERLKPALVERWASKAGKPLLAAPFCTVEPYAWDKYLP